MKRKLSLRPIACQLIATALIPLLFLASGCNKKDTEGAVSKPIIRAKVEGCIMSLQNLKAMMDATVVSTGNPASASDPNEVCKTMTHNDTCTVQDLEARIAASCAATDGSPWTWAASVDAGDPADFKIRGRAPQTQCVVCVSSAGFAPMNYDCSPNVNCP